MKKGLFVALLMVAVVAMAIPSLAMAPTIQELPDIVIGDTEDISGSGTTAKHLFKYLNVFNLFDSARIVWNNEGFPGDAKRAYLYRDTTEDPINIQASKPTGWVDTLNFTQYTNLLAGTLPGAGNIITADGVTTFGFLSLMNRDIETGAPANAYDATAAANGLTTTEIAALSPDPLVATDMILAAVEVPDSFPSPTTPTLIATKGLTVYTLMDWDDQTSGGAIPVLDFDFAGGSTQLWVGQSSPGVGVGYPALACTTESTITDGAIGFDGSAPHSAIGWGVWKSSNDGVNPQYVITADNREGLVLRCRAVMVTEVGATREACTSYRFNVQNLYGDHWSGVIAPSIVTGTDVEAIDCPAGGDPLTVELHWAVPYDLNEYADDGALNAVDWETLIPHPSIPADGRDYVIQLDGADISDTADIFMDSCVVEAYSRPADKATPDIEWGGGGGAAIPFNDPQNGFVANTSSPFAGIGIGTADIQAGYAQVTMGSGTRWQQISQDVTTVSQTVAEVANDLVRFTVEYNCQSSADTAPNIRFQTTACKNNPTSMADVDQTVWYDNLVPLDFLNGIYSNAGVTLDPAAEDSPGTPKTEALGGSTIDIYHYMMNTIPGTRFLRYYWDAYGSALPGTWGTQSGSLRVTSVVCNAGLPNP